MSEFQPELGQMVCPNSGFHEHQASDLLIAVLAAIGEEIEMVKSCPSPAGNVAEEFTSDVFQMRSYCWCDGDRHPDGCPPNFTWRDLSVSWYKYLGRGTSCNRPVTPDECSELLTECLAAVRAHNPEDAE